MRITYRGQVYDVPTEADLLLLLSVLLTLDEMRLAA
jgi:hypothetical protein